jgi:hypothetical protein
LAFGAGDNQASKFDLKFSRLLQKTEERRKKKEERRKKREERYREKGFVRFWRSHVQIERL